jgi:hypothetical protein
MRARPFILLDLTSQADYIPHETRRWPQRRMFAWLRQYGEVLEFPVRAEDNVEMAAMFIAPTGLTTTFFLTDEGHLRLYLGEHVMKTVWKPREVMLRRSGSATH